MKDALVRSWKKGLWLSKDHWQQMSMDAEQRFPEEACGLVAGRKRRSIAVFPVENQLHSPVRFRMHSQQQVDAYFLFLKNSWDLVAIYHSHPDGPDVPSPTDIGEAAYPEATNLIWSRRNKVWNCRGFLIYDGQVREVPIHLFS